MSSTSTSTSRIHRVIRPLRAKCIAASKAPSQPITYSAFTSFQSTSTSTSAGPLAIQPHTGSRDRTYAVLDAFGRVLDAFWRGTSEEEKSMGCLARCAARVIGENIEDAIRQECAEDEDAELEVSGELYECVPEYARIWTAIAHALDLVISLCPPTSTLLDGLYTHLLSHRLLHFSNTSLRFYLLYAFCSSPNPRIRHPSHAGFLVGLHRRYLSAFPDGSATFCGVFGEAMREASPKVFSSRAMWRFMRELRKTDMRIYVDVLATLAHEAMHRVDDAGYLDKEVVNGLSENLQDLLHNLPDDPLLSHHLFNLLESTFDLTSHSQTLSDIYICLATRILAHHSHLSTSILTSLHPTCTSYDLLFDEPSIFPYPPIEHLFTTHSDTLSAFECAYLACAQRHGHAVERELRAAETRHFSRLSSSNILATPSAPEMKSKLNYVYEEMVDAWVPASAVRSLSIKRPSRTIRKRARRRISDSTASSSSSPEKENETLHVTQQSSPLLRRTKKPRRYPHQLSKTSQVERRREVLHRRTAHNRSDTSDWEDETVSVRRVSAESDDALDLIGVMTSPGSSV